MTSTIISLLLLIALSCWRDKEALKEGGGVSRWVFYSLMAVSFGILIFAASTVNVFYPADWLGRVLRPLVPFP